MVAKHLVVFSNGQLKNIDFVKPRFLAERKDPLDHGSYINNNVGETPLSYLITCFRIELIVFPF